MKRKREKEKKEKEEQTRNFTRCVWEKLNCRQVEMSGKLSSLIVLSRQVRKQISALSREKEKKERERKCVCCVCVWMYVCVYIYVCVIIAESFRSGRKRERESLCVCVCVCNKLRKRKKDRGCKCERKGVFENCRIVEEKKIKLSVVTWDQFNISFFYNLLKLFYTCENEQLWAKNWGTN